MFPLPLLSIEPPASLFNVIKGNVMIIAEKFRPFFQRVTLLHVSSINLGEEEKKVTSSNLGNIHVLTNN